MEGSFSSAWPEDTAVVKRCLDGFVAFLAKCTLPPIFMHVMFRGGTVIRLDKDDGDDAIVLSREFDEQAYRSDFPTHRLPSPDDMESFVQDAQQDFAHAMNLCKTEEQKTALRKAYSVLVRDGYPLPGGQGADTVTLPMSAGGDVMATVFPHRNARILTISSFPVTGDALAQALVHAHDKLGREHRRLDAMCPRPYAIIDGLVPIVLGENDNGGEEQENEEEEERQTKRTKADVN